MTLRNLVFIFISTLGIHQARGQNAFLSYSDSAKWNVLECFWGDCWTETVRFDSDTTFCGYEYSKIEFPKLGETGYFRSDSLSTFFRRTGSCASKEYLLYDYSVSVGDTIYVGFELGSGTTEDTNRFYVESIDTVNFLGRERKRINLLYGFYPFFEFNIPMSWIEGIGSDIHPFYPFVYLSSGCECGHQVLCVDSAGLLLYQDPFYQTCDTMFTGIGDRASDLALMIYPNPFENSIILESKGEPIKEVTIFSALGDLIDRQRIGGYVSKVRFGRNLSSGVYFVQIKTALNTFTRKVVKLNN